ncbi:MAG: hypothetical protein M1837_002155 [Sclerophora amabilis]|nr:MAG: hypothetical protein M1837_002155 [Sclerophora amabilis]
MYLPRSLISHLYLHLLRTHHSLSPPVLVLVALEPDALCACRILTALLKRDYIQHKIQPVAGYGDLAHAGERLVRPMRTTEGGGGGVVVCLGVGGLVDLGSILGLEVDQEGGGEDMGGVEVWVVDARRPWNLGNVFGGHPSPITASGSEDNAVAQRKGVEKGRIEQSYKPGEGGIVVFDDGDIDDELLAEKDAYCALEQMPEIEEGAQESDGSDTESEAEDVMGESRPHKKRKSWSDREEEDDESEDEDGRPRQRRRSNASTPILSSPARPRPRGLVSTSTNADLPTIPSRSHSPAEDIPESAQPGKQPSARALRRRFLRLRRQHEAVLRKYYDLGTSYSEPISSLMYSLASELGREDNDLLWLAIVGVGSLELYGRSMSGVGISDKQHHSTVAAGWGGERGERIRQILRDEVRRLNPPELTDTGRDNNRGDSQSIIPTHARSPTDTSIRLSPEPRFLLIRHWSLYDSMLHSPYLSARLHIWSDSGRKRLHKLLAKMGVSLTQCKQSYTHMDMELKRGLRQRLLKYAPVYGLDGLVPPAGGVTGHREGWGFVRNWGFKACLSSTDVGVVVGAILEVGKSGVTGLERGGSWDRNLEHRELVDEEGKAEGEVWSARFWEAYDALENIDALKSALPTAMHLHRAILRTGTSLLEKRQIRHLRAFRMTVVKDGPDVPLFTHPAALTKLALWLGEAIAEQEREQKGKLGKGGRGTPLVVAGLNEARGVYVVVGLGGGGGVKVGESREEREKREKREKKKKEKDKKKEEKAAKKREKEAERRDRDDDDDDEDEEAETEDDDNEDSESSDEDDDDEDDVQFPGTDKINAPARNRFGNAFQEVVDETGARVRIDSFEHCVVEVRKEDLAAFLEGLSMKVVVG